MKYLALLAVVLWASACSPLSPDAGTPQADAGQPVADAGVEPLDVGAFCDSDDQCVSGLCGTDGRCAQDECPTAGSACGHDVNHVCAHVNCARVCVARGARGDRCSSFGDDELCHLDHACQEPLVCAPQDFGKFGQGLCAPAAGRDVDEPCNDNAQCTSNDCLLSGQRCQ